MPLINYIEIFFCKACKYTLRYIR
ncbi:hypothetical protein CSUI_005074, partial [Cystoisospora suis]